MNYCIVAFFIVLVIATLTWFFEGKGNYTGPKIDAAALQSGEVMGVAPDAAYYDDDIHAVDGEQEKKKDQID